MTNYIKKLKELRDKAKPKPWEWEYAAPGWLLFSRDGGEEYCVLDGTTDDGNDCNVLAARDDRELIAEMRNSLDLWLELAEELQVLLAMDYTKDVSHFDNVRASFAKLRGEF